MHKQRIKAKLIKSLPVGVKAVGSMPLSVELDRLLLVVQGLKTLFSDEHFVNLLRAEQLDTLPKYLAEKIQFAGMADAHPENEQALEGAAS